MRVEVVFLPDYLFVLFLLKHKDVEISLNKKNINSNRKNSLNNNINFLKKKTIKTVNIHGYFNTFLYVLNLAKDWSKSHK